MVALNIKNVNGFRIPDSPKKVLEIPLVYDCMQNLGGHNRTVDYILNKFDGHIKSKVVIDLGCGTGKLLKKLPDYKAYTGIDLHAPYILKAQKNFANDKTKFIAGSIFNLDRFLKKNSNSIFFALGFLHHLSNMEISRLFDSIRKIDDSPMVVTLDPVFCLEQTGFSRFLANSDRGKFVRWNYELEQLLKDLKAKIIYSETNSKIMRTKMNVCINLFKL